VAGIRPLVAALVLAFSVAVGTGPDEIARVFPTFEMSMPDRFGVDSDGDGLIDLPNTVEYVNGREPGGCTGGCPEATFEVVLDASASRVTRGGEEVAISARHLWDIENDGGLVVHLESYGPRARVDLPEGEYTVTLTMTAELADGRVTGRAKRAIVVEDLLVVAIGDSYASGEGNPERHQAANGGEAEWADGVGDEAVAASHAHAHRSTVAWPALTAAALEQADPYTSVTFVSVAASGATVAQGVLGGQNDDLPISQIGQVRALVGDREIDVFLISIGGNDIGFSHLIRGLVDADELMDPICYDTDLANVWAAVEDGDWGRGSSLDFQVWPPVACRATTSDSGPRLPGLQGLAGEFDRLAQALDTLDIDEVYLMEYPDPTGAAEIGTCREIVGDVTPPFGFHEISTREQEQGRLRVLDPLNDALAEAAARHDWTLIGGVADRFSAGHGYCGDWPDYGYPESYYEWIFADRLDFPDGWYRHPGRENLKLQAGEPGVTWYRTAAQSAVLQGPDGRRDTMGTMHPNELGHLAMARAAVAAVRSR
jgi:lysophospholipase L1-like esterase